MAYKAIGSPVFGLLYIMITNLCFAQEFLVSPQNTTVFLGQLPSPLFTCVTRGGLPGWWVNGTPYAELSNEERSEIQSLEEITDEGNRELTLTILAIAKYNGTKIQCRLFSFTGSLADESENVVLFIKGVPVFTLSSENNDASIPIIMNVRFSLDVTSVGPNVRYVIDQNHQIIFCVGCSTETYPYSLNITQPCYQYTFISDEGTTSTTGYILNATVVEPETEAISDNVSRVTFRALDSSVAGCHYEIERMTNCLVSPSSDQQNYLDLCANEYYAIGVSITDDSGGSAQTILQFSTFDVQGIQSTTDSNGLIQVTGEFITNSTARGMFIVLESEDGSPDLFRALLRQDSGPLLTSTIVNIPPSTYQLFAYDVEENLEVGTRVAYPQLYKGNGHLNTTSVSQLVSTPTFAFLKNATINVTGSTIKAVCEFKEGTQGASCVLVYRQYGNETLVLVENSQQSNALRTDVTVTITNPNNYTFAVFGKNSSYFNKQPFVMWPTTLTIASDDGNGETSSFNDILLAILVTILVIMIAIIAAVILYFMWRRFAAIYIKRKKIPLKDYSEPKILYTPQTSEHMMSKLKSFDVQWKRIAGFMRLDSHEIHGIATASGTDQQRLQQCINTWMNSDRTKPSPISSLIRMLMLEMTYFTYQWRSIAENMEFEPSHIRTIASYKWTDEYCLHRCLMIWITEMSPSIDKYSDIYSELVMSKLRSFAVQWKRIAKKMRLDSINEINGTNEQCLRQCVRIWVTGSQRSLYPMNSFIELLNSELKYFAGQWFEITKAVGFNEKQVDAILQNCETDKKCLQHCVKIWVTECNPSPVQFADVYSGLLTSRICGSFPQWKRIAEAMEFTKEEIADIATNQTDTFRCLIKCVQIWATGSQEKPSPICAFLDVLNYELRYFAVQWKQMAHAMGIGSDEIRNIDANSKNKEKCVENCVKIWITKLEPSPEQFAEVYSVLFMSRLGSFADEWKTIAETMGFDPSRVDNIASQYRTVNNKQRLRKCVKTWAEGSQEGPSPLKSFISIMMSKLMDFTSQWREIAEKMGIDMSLINEIGNNNETDKTYLRHCVKTWCTRKKPSPEKLSSIINELKNGGGPPDQSSIQIEDLESN